MILSTYTTIEGLAYPPGTKQNYTHSDFTILAKVLEKATGKPG
jgi:CubicO group peptidase (beta-lactamase class C family)